jgi:hypothetical protein
MGSGTKPDSERYYRKRVEMKIDWWLWRSACRLAVCDLLAELVAEPEAV